METSFGNWVRRRRKALDLTQQELANRIGCSLSLIFKIEADERRPSRQMAELLARHLELPNQQHELFLQVARLDKNIQHLDQLTRTSSTIPPAVSQPRTNLPVPLNALIGREHELAEIARLIQEPGCRLLTLTGPGGIGKTRLAIEAGRSILERFTDGVFLVALAGLGSAEYVIPAIGEALGISLSAAAPPKTQLLDALSRRDRLLILDNMEHLLEAGPLLTEILQHTPRTKFLVTSREPLHLLAEWTFDVQGLPIPEGQSVRQVEASSAAALFIERARQVRVDFALTDADRAAILRICRMLQGLPLGIELAASWVRALSCSEIAVEIKRGLDFLGGATLRDLPERHRSMRAVLDQSWNILSAPEQRALCWLSVFRGGFSRDAAVIVAGASLGMLLALVEKSLVRRTEPGRFELHELTRQYALEQLIDSGELNLARDRHLDYFLSYVERANAGLYTGDQVAWLNRLEREIDNLRAALDWALQKGDSQAEGREDLPLRLAGMLHQFWKRRNHWSEGREWLRRALAQPKAMKGTPERARALNAAALLAVEQTDTVSAIRLAQENLALSRLLNDQATAAAAQNTFGMVLWKQKKFAEARSYCETALRMYREIKDLHGVADTLHSLGHITINQGDYQAAQGFLEESHSAAAELGNQIGSVEALGDLGLVAYLQRDFGLAQSHLEESLRRFREADILPGIEATLNRLGDLARSNGNFERAGELYTESLNLYRESNDLDEIASLLHNLGHVASHRGDLDEALAHFREALEIQKQAKNSAGIAECLMGIAGVVSAQGRVYDGARLFAAGESLRREAGAALWPANEIEYEWLLGQLRGALSETELTAAWDEGSETTVEQALAQLPA